MTTVYQQPGKSIILGNANQTCDVFKINKLTKSIWYSKVAYSGTGVQIYNLSHALNILVTVLGFTLGFNFIKKQGVK